MSIIDWMSDLCSSDLALENCPAGVTDIFRTGSLLSHAASRVGAADWAEVMRARVGDVYMRWDPNDKVPLFSAIPACPRHAHDAERSGRGAQPCVVHHVDDDADPAAFLPHQDRKSTRRNSSH